MMRVNEEWIALGCPQPACPIFVVELCCFLPRHLLDWFLRSFVRRRNTSDNDWKVAKMTTQYVRESVHSRLSPFRQAIEELNARREDGFNGFTSDEPGVGRLLNSLDIIFNTDVEHPGEFFDFIKCGLESIPRQPITHQPLEQVLERKSEDRVENFRLWLIYSLNLTGSLKHSLHATLLPMRDVLSCFVHKSSILFMDSFTDEFLGSLATLHNPPIGDGQTTFKLDAGALSLFEERPIQVMVQAKGGSHRGGPSRSVISNQRGVQRATAARRQDGEGSKPAKPSERRKVLLCERSMQTAEAEHPPQPVPSTRADSSGQAALPTVRETCDACTNTDHPSPLMSFQDLMEAQESVEAIKAEQRAICENLRGQENDIEEAKRDYMERMEIVVATIRQLKALYNELFMRSLEAQDGLLMLTEEDVDARILDVFRACKEGRTVASREAVHQAAMDERQSVRDAGMPKRRRGDVVAKQNSSPMLSPRSSDGAPSQTLATRTNAGTPRQVSSSVSESAPLTQQKLVNTPTAQQSPSAALPAESPAQLPKKGVPSRPQPGSTASPGGPSLSTGAVNSVMINSHQLETETSTTTPLSCDAMIPVDHTKLITSEPTEFDRPQQLELQGNRCASCGTTFGDSGDRNLVLKVVQKAGETLRLQKPRRCHYCVRLFCHRCHANKMAALPFRVLQRWDFSPQHVCNRDFEFLSKNLDRAFYALPSLPHELQLRPNVQQAAFLRKRLVLLCKILSQCSHDKAAPFSAFLHTHYAQREHFYSLADFSKLRGGEGNRLMMAAATPINAMGSLVGSIGGSASATHAQGGPGPNDDLVTFLTTQYTKAMQHVKECRQCVARSSMKCGLCTESSMVSVVDDDSFQCKTCLNIYHVPCMEISNNRCPMCAKK